ncbi:unnamed protein product [Rotaria sp. Silwood1]|nr:unnamed protein product [Rotaria sp. Silwood1]CAF3394679.1 unnamed protein product [Rotaria sp. Silwood1]CAF4586262.1 unnamed protein product [Rotaria sp. Silwood1]CAF4878298.1 unnamed protein product [Rotaria sp. Silwood1]
MTRMSLIQIPSLPLIILESDSGNLKRYKSSLNIILFDNVKDQQSLKFISIDFIHYFEYHLEALLDRDQSRILDDFNNFFNKKYPNKNHRHHIVTRQESDNMKESNEYSDNIHEYENAVSLSNQAFETLSSTTQPILEDSPISIEYIDETQSISTANPFSPIDKARETFAKDNEDLHLSHHSSELKFIQMNNTIQRFDQQKQSSDKINALPVMKISGTLIDNINEDKDLSYLKRQKRYKILNPISNFQSNIHNVHVRKLMINLSSSILTNIKNDKQKNKRAMASTKGVRRKKRIRRKQIRIQSSWISTNENPSIYNYLFNKSIKRTSISLKPLKNPCEVLELDTKFKHTHCEPYQCICTPLPPCLDISSHSLIENSQMCNIYLI